MGIRQREKDRNEISKIDKYSPYVEQQYVDQY